MSNEGSRFRSEEPGSGDFGYVGDGEAISPGYGHVNRVIVRLSFEISYCMIKKRYAYE